MELEREELEFRDSMYRPEEIRFKRRNEEPTYHGWNKWGEYIFTAGFTILVLATLSASVLIGMYRINSFHDAPKTSSRKESRE